MRVLLLIPPMTQLNTPYPATAFLTGFLRKQGFEAVQVDPAIELILRLLSKDGLSRVRAELNLCARRLRPGRKGLSLSDPVRQFLSQSDRYIAVVEPTIRFLQGKDPSLAHRIVSRDFLP